MASLEPVVRFHGHACTSVEVNGEVLLQDPWFAGDVFNDSWSLLVAPDLDAIPFERIRHIWISHEHPDHLHFESLRTLRERIEAPEVTVYYREEQKSNVGEAIRKLGFAFVALAPERTIQLCDGLSLTSFPERSDCALVIEAGARILLNQNDCRLSKRSVRRLLARYPKIDAWFFQFSLAGWSGNADDPGALERARQAHLALIRSTFARLKPHIYVPFASFVYFCKDGNAYLNDWAVTPDDLFDALPDLPLQLLWSGDALAFDGDPERTAENRTHWRSAYAAPKPVRPHPPVEETEILEAAERLVEEAGSWGIAALRPGETHIQIRETGRILSLDLRSGRVEMRETPGPKRLAAVLPGEELLFFLRFPWGADTLNITACVQVLQPFRWRWLTYFRHGVYRLGRSHQAVLPVAAAAARSLPSLRDVVSRIKQAVMRTGFPVPKRLTLVLEMLRFGPWLRAQGDVPHFPTRGALHAWVASRLEGPIDYLEFGVFRGESLRSWMQLADDPASRFFGFDSFQGLPEDWELPTKTLGAGEYDAGGALPAIDDERVRFVVGLFQDTLPDFLRTYHAERRLVLHLDADLYSATLYVLTSMDAHLAPGAILLFDEFSAVHEFVAYRNWCEAYGRSCRLLGTAGPIYAQTALEVCPDER